MNMGDLRPAVCTAAWQRAARVLVSDGERLVLLEGSRTIAFYYTAGRCPNALRELPDIPYVL